MTTFAFTPQQTSPPFQFQPTLDGQVYNVTVTWNLFGQRWYVNIYDLGFNLIVCLPLIGSPNDYPISLTAGYFTSTLVFYAASQQFVVTP
jgi:hypothetical protein